MNWEEKGHKVELVGKEEVEGTEAYKLHVVTAEGDEMDMFLDSEYCLEFRREMETEMMGQKMKIVMSLGDYKDVGGVLMPFSIEAVPEGAPAGQVITFTEAEINIELSDDRFAMPEVPAKAEGEETTEGGE